MSKERLDFGREQDRAFGKMEIKWLDADSIPNQGEQAGFAVVERESELASQEGEAARSTQFVEIRDDFDVRPYSGSYARLSCQIGEFAMVINLAVTDDKNGIARIADRLRSCSFEKRELGVSQCDLAIRA